ncbi:MAG: hypothetical protein A2654_00890 [Candidatus Nealsonbacteria bacterium RIFCSPHIGHO2_01_FULL_43_31]|uniref:Uncharacterized protein n=2 Tax=Candidatus Nealsoniibacteriota TaxID=1817911 RepID=A0A1G2E7X7_9BACT|nr:MAG: hypothetical protein UV98_C0012G0004 [Parcubacteria group bacterium GW2011_GWB1_43_6]OGZ20648.1 MAG: hypothetical protein A2654_00890 [Candidatus Nealsonbacteria bacterium RIFCSPHIGHO2_01_FULL_43_31]OGZ21732.1 MAG: hypothetical protein A3D46_01680 [Candidatus Nealsonbacteria bacterium RIFCSPHIGHO2_02_FULL_43_13]OGZ25223.1 MAG: hypothetical protein A2922_00070 [Candidatus Nealsonbacteria bacterium RIFCSPLOWO2_01_FULL_43_36]
MGNIWNRIRVWFSPSLGWSTQHKIFIYVSMILLVAALVLSWTTFRTWRLVDVSMLSTSTPAPAPTPSAITREITPQSVLDELARLKQEKTKDQGTIADLRAQISKIAAPAPTPLPIVWPKTSMVITSDEARGLLTRTFPNRRMTGAHFVSAALYTVEQFKEIRSKMAPLTSNLPWSSLVDKALGTFQEPDIEQIPIGWAYPASDPMYLIVILADGGQAKIFGFDPLDKTKIWEIVTDPRVEAAIVR